MIERSTQIRVGYRDTDQMGVVHHAVYLEFFETGRTEFLRSLGLPYSDMEQRGVMLPLLAYGAEIVRPARYDEVLVVSARLDPPQGARLRIDYTISRRDELLVTGFTLHAFTTVNGMRPIRPPREFLEVLRRNDS